MVNEGVRRNCHDSEARDAVETARYLREKPSVVLYAQAKGGKDLILEAFRSGTDSYAVHLPALPVSRKVESLIKEGETRSQIRIAETDLESPVWKGLHVQAGNLYTKRIRKSGRAIGSHRRIVLDSYAEMFFMLDAALAKSENHADDLLYLYPYSANGRWKSISLGKLYEGCVAGSLIS